MPAKKSDQPSKAAKTQYDAIVIGSGPNGMTAAIVLAKQGMKVLVVEAGDTIGGGCRSKEFTLPGYIHDVCSSIHPLGVGSPIFRTMPLEQHGLKWVHPEAPYAHPLDGGKAILVERSIEKTAANMGEDSDRYFNLMNSLNGNWDEVCATLRSPLKLASHPFIMARFGVKALMPADMFARTFFGGSSARAAFAGVAAHSSLPLGAMASASMGMVLNLAAHTVGWPMPQGGAQKLSAALASYLKKLGGEIVTGWQVQSLDELPQSKIVMCDITPAQLLQIAGSKVSGFYRKQLQSYRYGAASFKLDWALDGPIPWLAEECHKAGTVHIGGSLEEIERSEQTVAEGRICEKPYVLLAQNSLFDPSRAPAKKHTAWAYCHLPNGSTYDMTEHVEDQVERFAPGFKKLILKRHVLTPAGLNQYNANYVGGDINGGALYFNQLLMRPVLRLIPYTTSVTNLYLCSSATPPGSGVHGMCGYYAALAALKRWSL